MFTKKIRIFVHLFLSVFVIWIAYLDIQHFNQANQILDNTALNTKGK